MKFNSSQFDPETGNGFEPIPEGDYPFEVVEATVAVSKNSNEMIELELAVDVGRERSLTVYDRLVAVETALWKINSFCKSTSLNFNSDELLPEHCVGRRGLAHFILGEPNQAGRRYLEVERYLPSEESKTSSNTKSATENPKPRPIESGDETSEQLPF
ncbi:MAG: DUF669 domain-containing protein [Planctomycetes bacterium]|nr:DUF669 domain-containing protein [Planctomycetota bacterium]